MSQKPELIPVRPVHVLQCLLLVHYKSTAPNKALARASGAGLQVLLKTRTDDCCLAMRTDQKNALDDAGGEEARVRQKRLLALQRTRFQTLIAEEPTACVHLRNRMQSSVHTGHELVVHIKISDVLLFLNYDKMIN